MLQIFIYGPTTSGYLDLEPGTTLQMEETDPLFDDEESLSGQYSLPVTIPWTDHNRRLLGFAERIHNMNTAPSSFTCDVYDRGWIELSGGKFTLLEKIGEWSYRKGNFSASVSGIKGRFGNLIKNKKLKDLDLGGIITFTTDSRTFAQQVMEGMFPQYNYIRFVPVAIENFFDQQRPDYDNEFLAKDTVNNVILTDDGWLFGRPLSSNPDVAVEPGEEEYRDYRTVPFFKFQFVLKACFSTFGFNVSGDFITDTAFDDLLLFNNFAIEKYTGAIFDSNTIIKPQNHMPDMLVQDFIIAVLKTWKLKMSFTGSNTVVLSYKKTALLERRPADITGFITNNFKSTLPGVDELDGVNVRYEFDENDEYPGERLKELATRTLAASVSLRSQLPALSIGRQLTTDDYVYCQQDNMFYLVADATNPGNIRYDCWAENLFPLVTGNGEKEVVLPISPLFQYVEFNSIQAVWQRRNYLACRMAGSYTNNAANPVINPFGLRMFFGGVTTIFGQEQPASWNWNRHNLNIPNQTYNLSLQGAGSLGQELHRDWEEFLNSAETVEVTVITDRKLDYLLQQNSQFTIDNIVFFKKKRERSLPARHTELLHLVPANAVLSAQATATGGSSGSVSSS